jgi:hypothetical protein
MSNVEYQDFQTLETEIKDYAKQIETLGTEQKDHQEDLIKVQKTLLSFKSSKGFDGYPRNRYRNLQKKY